MPCYLLVSLLALIPVVVVDVLFTLIVTEVTYPGRWVLFAINLAAYLLGWWGAATYTEDYR